MTANGANSGSFLAGSKPLGDLESPSLEGNVDVHVGKALAEGSTGSLDDDVLVLDGSSDCGEERRKKKYDFNFKFKFNSNSISNYQNVSSPFFHFFSLFLNIAI